jgi:mannitol-1-phosphate/altronate dehydrogenase
MTRLSNRLLNQLPADVEQPGYARAALKPGIVHLGIGAFHRAHQAWYTEAGRNREGGDWGIVGCSLRSATARDQLAPQDGLYTLVERDGEGLKKALRTILELEETAQGVTRAYLNMTTSATLVAAAALRRTESRGGHFRTDHPEPSETWEHHTTMTLAEAHAIRAAA